jgi:hypothetical protein
MQGRCDRSKQSGHRCAGERSDAKRNREHCHQARRRSERYGPPNARSCRVRDGERLSGIAHIVACERNGPLSGRRARGAHGNRNVGCRKRCVVNCRMPYDAHDISALRQCANFSAAIRGQHLGPNVFYVEGIANRFAGVARFAAQEHRFDARVEQPLHGGTGACAQSILKGDETDNTIP